MIDVRGLFGVLPTTTVTLRTFAAATIDDYGVPSVSPSDASLTAIVHPADRRELERLPEADRTRETIAVYSLLAIDTAGSVRPAQIVYAGRTYEVASAADYGAMGGIYLLLAQLIEDRAA